MMNLLAIDTATDRFSIALGCFPEKAIGDVQEVRNLPRSTRSITEEETEIKSKLRAVPQDSLSPCTPWLNILAGDTWLLEADVGLRHSELSMDCIDTLMRQAALKPEDLNGIVCMGGPGSFTGLRIGFSLAKGLACALNIPFATVPTLDCMVWPLSALPGIVVPVIDAKKGAYFCALYQNGKKLSDDMDATPREIAGELAARGCIRRILNHGVHGETRRKMQKSKQNSVFSVYSVVKFFLFGQSQVTLIGPGAPLLYEQLCAMNLQGGISLGTHLRWGNAATLLHIARESGIITRGDKGNSAGPEYIRKSDAELGKA
jgi:tRNA threonylcarbamoyladenosine biosynthesis protein TsaB